MTRDVARAALQGARAHVESLQKERDEARADLERLRAKSRLPVLPATCGDCDDPRYERCQGRTYQDGAPPSWCPKRGEVTP